MRMAEPDITAGEDTTEDLFLGDKIAVRQPAKGYRAGTDAVLLAATIGEGFSGSVLDAGSGVGTVGLCVAARLPGAGVVMVEREPELVALARANISRNGFGGRVSVVEADVTRVGSAFDATGIVSETFDRVLANPPFHDSGAGTRPPSLLKAGSHQMPRDALDAWARFMSRMAAPGGVATIIHKAETLPRVLAAFEGRFGAIGVLPVLAREGENAIRVIVSGTKGSRAPMRLRPPLVLHTSEQAFRPEIEAVFRYGAALPT